jgi:hypothetical protein
MKISRVHLVSSQPLLSDSPTLIASGTLSGSFTSVPVDIQHLEHWSATLSAQGVYGQATWQVANDLSTLEWQPTQITNWAEYPQLRTPVSCSGGNTVQTFWQLQHQGYAYVRFVWTHLAGTGSIDLTFTAKGT